MKYYVLDLYEGIAEIIGVFDNAKEAKSKIRERIRETDGECLCRLLKEENEK